METLKRTISVSGELELLQMMSELDTENVGPPREDELWDSTSIGEENETLLGGVSTRTLTSNGDGLWDHRGMKYSL